MEQVMNIERESRNNRLVCHAESVDAETGMGTRTSSFIQHASLTRHHAAYFTETFRMDSL